MGETRDAGNLKDYRGDPHLAPKILVVDDEVTVLDFLSTFLQSHGYDVLRATDGPTALDRAGAGDITLVLLDLYLPGLDGFEVCRRLKADAATSHLPVICITGAADTENRLRILKAGANDFLAKPFDPQELLLRVRNILRLKEADLLEKEHEASRRQHAEMVGKIAVGVAHEVRNPLHAIMSLTEALCLKVGGGAEYEPFVLHIRAQVERLSVLMRELLDFGKPLERERLKVLPFTAICRDLEAQWRDHPAAALAPLRIEPVAGDEALAVLVDPLKITQALLNLLENGADHAPPGAPLRVLVRRHPGGGSLAVEVIDAGCGLPEEIRTRAFEPFFTTRRKGTGLGLGIVRRIVEDHGGTVTLQDNGDSPGTTATILLPLSGEGRG